MEKKKGIKGNLKASGQRTKDIVRSLAQLGNRKRSGARANLALDWWDVRDWWGLHED